jgi:hypothetical protein
MIKSGFRIHEKLLSRSKSVFEVERSRFFLKESKKNAGMI